MSIDKLLDSCPSWTGRISDLYVRHSPSKLNKAAACPSIFVVEEFMGLKQDVGARAHRGTAVEAGVAFGLADPSTKFSDCVAVANAKYDELTAMSGDERREKYRDSMPDMIFMALEELLPYGIPSQMQGFVTWQPDDLKLPIVGYYDFMWEDRGFLTDLKTTEKMPSEIKIGHARQVALYAGDNAQASLTYVTPKKSAQYMLENIRGHRQALHNIARIVEHWLSLSDDPKYFLKMFAPDLESFYWGNPAARQLAYELWKI